MKILSHASAKKKTKRLKGFKFRLFIGRFQCHRDSEGVNKPFGGAKKKKKKNPVRTETRTVASEEGKKDSNPLLHFYIFILVLFKIGYFLAAMQPLLARSTQDELWGCCVNREIVLRSHTTPQLPPTPHPKSPPPPHHTIRAPPPLPPQIPTTTTPHYPPPPPPPPRNKP